MLRFRSIYWVALIKVASTVGAAWVSTNTFCVRIKDHTLCPGDGPEPIVGEFQIQSGFAPFSVKDSTRRPKWQDTFNFPEDLEENRVVFGQDYCFFTKQIDRVRGLGCAQECYKGENNVPNPWFGRDSRGQQPNYGDPIAGQVNRYMPTTLNTCPNPNSGMTSQLEVGSGYLASNDLQSPAEDKPTGDTALDTTPDFPGVQALTQNQANPDNNVLGLEANALTPATAADRPNVADALSNGFSDPEASYLKANQFGSTDKTLIGSGAGTTITTPNVGVTLPAPGNGIGTIGRATNEDNSPKTFDFDTLPFFRKRNAKSARDFRL